jgi:hypothetical protein
MRGIWHFENYPYEEKFSDELEKKHFELFKESLMSPTDADNSWINVDTVSIGEDASSSSSSSNSSNVKSKKTDGKVQTEGNTFVVVVVVVVVKYLLLMPLRYNQNLFNIFIHFSRRHTKFRRLCSQLAFER